LYILSKKSHKLYIYMKHGPNGWRHHITFWHEQE
jgi:hypothetical protein